MVDESCKYFKSIHSLVPYVHEEKICFNKLPLGRKEIYNFESYLCDSEKSIECETFRRPRSVEDILN